MLFHLSIDAHDPEHVAGVIAELWEGEAFPFPPVIEGSWIAMAGDERNSAVEVYPRGTELHMAEGSGDGYGLPGTGGRSPTHFAMGTNKSLEEVMAIAARENWPAKYCKRGNIFGVIEVWVEGDRMVEILTRDMQTEYLATMTLEGWKTFMVSLSTPL
ncbi:hypothetical protein [Hyphomonas sp.]|uniref:hypothetical protein n=1 Tax=Hyphomonas sp. TaxID=87 RepID=UPI003242A573